MFWHVTILASYCQPNLMSDESIRIVLNKLLPIVLANSLIDFLDVVAPLLLKE
jgi:hypothetical protein